MRGACKNHHGWNCKDTSQHYAHPSCCGANQIMIHGPDTKIWYKINEAFYTNSSIWRFYSSLFNQLGKTCLESAGSFQPLTDELFQQWKIIPSATRSTHAPGSRFTFGWGKGVEKGSWRLGTICQMKLTKTEEKKGGHQSTSGHLCSHLTKQLNKLVNLVCTVINTLNAYPRLKKNSTRQQQTKSTNVRFLVTSLENLQLWFS